MGKRITALFIGALCLAGGLAAQTPQPILKGKVIDRGGETVIGAHVKWKNAQGGAVTDLDGNFSIPETGTELVISFLGYKTQTIKIKPGQKNLVVTLEDDAQDLDELVVVGYGTQKKASLTGSIETIKSEDLLSLPTANLDEALYGQVAGCKSCKPPVTRAVPRKLTCISGVSIILLCLSSTVCRVLVRPPATGKCACLT